MEDEGVDLIRLGDLRELGQLLLRVNVGQAVVAKDAELAAQAQVNARGLQVALVPRIDDEAPGGDLLLNAAVAEDGNSGPPSRCLTLAILSPQ
jgi:hypothetical protein